jgi:hypothetical protein
VITTIENTPPKENDSTFALARKNSWFINHNPA